jgi:hypothetical protein
MHPRSHRLLPPSNPIALTITNPESTRVSPSIQKLLPQYLVKSVATPDYKITERANLLSTGQQSQSLDIRIIRHTDNISRRWRDDRTSVFSDKRTLSMMEQRSIKHRFEKHSTAQCTATGIEPA